MKHPIRIIGVTGGIGCGKSTFAGELQKLGCRLIDGDEIAHALIDSDVALQKALAEAFGPHFFDDNGHVKRRDLGKHVFGDPAALDLLNRIVWPPLLAKIQTMLERFIAEDNVRPIVVDLAILFEADVADWFDLIIVVSAPLEKRVDWLAVSRGWDKEEIIARINAQWSLERKKRCADVLVENKGDLESLKEKARLFYQDYLYHP